MQGYFLCSSEKNCFPFQSSDFPLEWRCVFLHNGTRVTLKSAPDQGPFSETCLPFNSSCPCHNNVKQFNSWDSVGGQVLVEGRHTSMVQMQKIFIQNRHWQQNRIEHVSKPWLYICIYAIGKFIKGICVQYHCNSWSYWPKPFDWWKLETWAVNAFIHSTTKLTYEVDLISLQLLKCL